MRHPEILLLPALMLADYHLTRAAAVLRDRGYSERFRTEHYELNPVLQKAIREKRWFSARHLAGVVVVTGLLVFVFETEPVPDELVEALLGFFLVLFGALIGRHVSNILTFRRMNRAAARPTPEVTGVVTMSHAMSLSLSMYQYLTVIVPMTLLAAFAPTPAVLGGCAGAWELLLVHGVWMWKHKRALARQTAKSE